jgi:hypothetical protein
VSLGGVHPIYSHRAGDGGQRLGPREKSVCARLGRERRFELVEGGQHGPVSDAFLSLLRQFNQDFAAPFGMSAAYRFQTQPLLDWRSSSRKSAP